MHTLKELEAKIIHPTTPYVEVGEAIVAIRNHEFAEMQDHNNLTISSSRGRFQAVTGCAKLNEYWAKLGLSDRRVRELVAAARTYRNLEGGVPTPSFPLPKTERLIRFIAWLTIGPNKPDIEGQRAIWLKAVDLFGENPSSPQIKLVIQEYHKKKIVGIRNGMATSAGDLNEEEKKIAAEAEFNAKFRELWYRITSRHRNDLEFSLMYNNALQTLNETKAEHEERAPGQTRTG